MNINTIFLGDVLIKKGILTRSQLEEALSFQQGFIIDLLKETDFNRVELISKSRDERKEIPKIGEILLDKGFLKLKELNTALQYQAEKAMDPSVLNSKKLAKALKVGFIINSSIDILEVLSLIMKYANIVTDGEGSTLMLMDDKTGELVFSVPTGTGSDDLKDIRIPPGKGIAGWVAENQQYVLVKDTKSDPRFYSQIDHLSGIETKSLLCVPLRSNRKLIGVLEVVNKKDGGTFNEDDALLLSILSHQAAIAIENAMLFTAVQDKIENEKRIEKMVAESDRIRSIGTFAGGISHDFNNILSGIIGFTQLALMEAPENSDLSKNLEKVLEASDRAKDLIKQILTYSRQSETNFNPVNVRDVIEEALKLIKVGLPKNVEIIENLECNEQILGDSTQLHQVIMNLCSNAAHAIGSNEGMLEVLLEKVQSAEPFALQDDILPFSASIKIKVADTGKGMPSEIVKHIFEPFFTTKKKEEGTGMGLSVVQGIIKSHGGEIKVESILDKGTAFEIYLPIYDSAEDEKALKIAPDYLAGTEHILFVDDDILLAEGPKKILNSLGYKVTLEHSGKEALKRFKQEPNNYDVVVTDLSMPEMTGDKMAYEMMKIRPEIPIILCTGFDTDFTELSARELGLKAFLKKPVMMNDLLIEIRNAL